MLEVKNIFKRFNQTIALKNISFSVNPGEVLAILGPNGSGKSTLYKILAGILEPDSGDIEYRNTDTKYILHSNNKIIQKSIGYCPQSPIFWKNISIYEHMEFIAKNFIDNSKNRKSYLEEILSKLDLLEVKTNYFHEMSGGMQKRFSIAMAIVSNPKFLILDEPTNGLDVHSKQSVNRLIHDLSDRGMGILISGHDLYEIQKTARRFLFLKKGELNYQTEIINSTLESLYLEIYKYKDGN